MAPPPVPAKRRAVFYGWWIVLGGLIGQFVAIGTQGTVSGAFLAPMTQDLGWDRAHFTIAASLSTALSGFVGFAIGGRIDRHGARPLMLIGTTILGAALISTSLVHTLWQFILLRGVVTTFGFVLIGNLVVNVAISKWFVHHRGWAISIASLGVSLSSVVLTPTMVRVVDIAGWRNGWIVLGIGTFMLAYPAALLMRRQPEDFGLLPDGARAGDVGAEARVALADADLRNSFTRREATRTAAMWLLVAAFGLSLMGIVSVLFHAIPFLTDAGFTRSQAALLFSSQGVSALLSKFVWGWWMQHAHPRVLTAFSFLSSGAGVALMVPAAHAGSFNMELGAFLLFGWGIGGTIPLGEFIWASFFGRRHLGEVRAAALPVTIIFSAAGPILAGAYFDRIGSYDGVFFAFVSMWVLGMVLVMLARPPARPVASGAQPAPSIRITAPGLVTAAPRNPPQPPTPAILAARPAAATAVASPVAPAPLVPPLPEPVLEAPPSARPPRARETPPVAPLEPPSPEPVEATPPAREPRGPASRPIVPSSEVAPLEPPATRWRADVSPQPRPEPAPLPTGFRAFQESPALPVVLPVRPVAVVPAQFEVSLGQMARAAERRLTQLSGAGGRELLPAMAVGAAASVMTVAALMLLRRDHPR